MHVLAKLKEHGLFWVIRRLVRECVEPTTVFGQRLKPCSLFVYLLISKPVNFLNVLIKGDTRSKKWFYFFYDFEVEPITYDFAWALCIANAKREEVGLSHLRVVFVPGTVQGLRKESAEYEQIIGPDARNWRINAILLPVIKLLPCPSSIIFCATREEGMLIREKQAQFVYPEKYNVTFPVPCSPKQAMRYRQKFMALRADKQALEYVSKWLHINAKAKKIIVITLRQYGYTLERNSNIQAWAQFANTLDKAEFFIVFIPDTEQALCGDASELKDHTIFHPACWNLNLRGALYELAYLNLGVNTGPMALCWLNPNARYITFKTSVKNVAQAPIEVLIDRGFVPGQNPLFTNKFQKWVWDDDDFDTLWREFWLMYHSIKGDLDSD